MPIMQLYTEKEIRDALGWNTVFHAATQHPLIEKNEMQNIARMLSDAALMASYPPKESMKI